MTLAQWLSYHASSRTHYSCCSVLEFSPIVNSYIVTLTRQLWVDLLKWCIWTHLLQPLCMSPHCLCSINSYYFDLWSLDSCSQSWTLDLTNAHSHSDSVIERTSCIFNLIWLCFYNFSKQTQRFWQLWLPKWYCYGCRYLSIEV